eukprot:4595962-Amphidinium_carterae.1
MMHAQLWSFAGSRAARGGGPTAALGMAAQACKISKMSGTTCQAILVIHGGMHFTAVQKIGCALARRRCSL